MPGTNHERVGKAMELDRAPLWRGDHVEIRQLVEDFARYLDLPRLAGPAVPTTPGCWRPAASSPCLCPSTSTHRSARLAASSAAATWW
jgi:hypothetical protein